jgi:hypothetical protein
METYGHDYPMTEHDDSYPEVAETFHQEDCADHSEPLPGVAQQDDHGGYEAASFHNDGGQVIAPLYNEEDDEDGFAAGDSAGEALAMGNGRSFGENYKACMATMGMPAPSELFGTYEKALASAGLIAVALEKFGTGATIAELVGAGLLSEVFLAIGACGAAAYLGVSAGCVVTAGSDTVIG